MRSNKLFPENQRVGFITSLAVSLLLASTLTACTTTDEDEADDEIQTTEEGSGSGSGSASEEGSDEALVGENGSGSDEVTTECDDPQGDDDDECGDPEKVATNDPSQPIPALENEIPEPPIVTEAVAENHPIESQQQPGPGQQTKAVDPQNNGRPPQHMTQADVRLDCRKIGPGLAAGFVRYGCNAMKINDGQHYGIVIGWWRVMRRDGARAHARDLNFREQGYDMAFDVEEGDTSGGILMAPAQGEEAPLALLTPRR